MGIFENIALAFAGLKSNKMRAFLTMLGIIIGIGSVIAISTLGNIMKTSVMDIFNTTGGANLVAFGISIKQGAERKYINDDEWITTEMVYDVREKFQDEIQEVSLFGASVSGKIRIRRDEYDITVNGVNSGYLSSRMSKIIAGRYINDADCDQMRNVCVISDKQAKKIFGSVKGAVGQPISVTVGRGNTIMDFTVVGVYQFQVSGLMGSMAGMMGADDWSTEMDAPFTTIARAFNQTEEEFYSFNVTMADGVNPDEFCKRVAAYMNHRYYRDNDSIEIIYQTMDFIMGMVDNVMGLLELAISVIAGISLLVGGIGVMNIMLVSVTERTREIGVRKAMGAPNSAIRTQFIVESIIICLIGGSIGILVGIGMGNLAGLIVGTNAPPTIGSIILAVSFSMAIGVFFGYYPANRAAKLDPIEALRYE